MRYEEATGIFPTEMSEIELLLDSVTDITDDNVRNVVHQSCNHLAKVDAQQLCEVIGIAIDKGKTETRYWSFSAAAEN